MTSTLHLAKDGDVDIAERGEPDANGAYPATKLVKTESEVTLYLGLDEDGDIELTLSAYHVLNDETKRAFHTSIDCPLDDAELKCLRSFIDFLLARRREDEP